MRRALLDTDILSDYLKGIDPQVVAQGQAYGRHHDQLEFTSVTVHEITFGLLAKGATTQAMRVGIWMERNVEHPPLPADYRLSAEVRATAQRQGLIVHLPDALIASVAYRLGLPIVTANTGDFEAIRKAGLAIELLNWRVSQ